MIVRPMGSGSELPYFGLNFAVVTDDTEELLGAFDKEEDAIIFKEAKENHDRTNRTIDRPMH